MLKKFMLSAAVATMVAAPAFGQAYYGSIGSGNIVSPNGVPVTASTPAYGKPGKAYAHAKPAGGYSTSGFNAFAYEPPAHHGKATTNHKKRY